ncbi:MAG: response regulator [Caldilineaceae bacterium]
MSNVIGVLVVEDSELAVEGIRSVNAYDDIEVIGATNAVAAVDLLRRRRPDVVLLDLRMRRHAQEPSKEQVGLIC